VASINPIDEAKNIDRVRISEEKMRASPTIFINVEGRADELWLKPLIAEKKNGRRFLTKSASAEGKEEVIDNVLNGNYDFGIVDMDHDFDGDKICSPSICDTRDYCCTFAAILEGLGESQLLEIILESIEPSGRRHVKQWFEDSSVRYVEFLPRVARISTKLRLFCAYFNDEFRNTSVEDIRWGKEFGREWYNTIFEQSQNLFAIQQSDLDEFVVEILREHSDHALQMWREFEENYRDVLNNCGINDHEIERCIEYMIGNRMPEHRVQKFGVKNAMKKYGMKLDWAPKELLNHLRQWGALAE
jgi:hypothetical protein